MWDAEDMPPLISSSTRPSRYNGDSIPPRTGGGGDGRGREGGDSLPNYGDRLHRARRALAIALVPIFMLFISFTAVYVIRRLSVGLNTVDLSNHDYVQSWIPVRLPWTLLLINTIILVLSSITIELARRAITREAALAPVRSIPGVSLGDESHFPWLSLTTILGVAFLAG